VTAGRDMEALIAGAQAGEIRAFEELVAAHLGVLRRYARAFARREADADDLAQDALVKVFKSLRLFRYQCAFSTWLYTVVRSVFLDAAKSRGGRERALEDPLEPGAAAGELAPAADELMAREQERQRVWRALREVPVEFRGALVLFDLEGRSYDEVAAIEQVAIGTVKSRLSRGRAHLRRLLEADGVPPSAEVEENVGAPGTGTGAASSQAGRSRS
jgi:RNA polymerase sigma-70 factor, ECF subfamily